MDIHRVINCVCLCGSAGGERAHQGGEGRGQIPPIQLPHQVHEYDGAQSRLLHWLVLVTVGKEAQMASRCVECESGENLPSCFFSNTLMCLLNRCTCVCAMLLTTNVSAGGSFDTRFSHSFYICIFLLRKGIIFYFLYLCKLFKLSIFYCSFTPNKTKLFFFYCTALFFIQLLISYYFSKY